MNKIIPFVFSICIAFSTLAQEVVFDNLSQLAMGSTLADAGEFVTYDHEGNILVYGYFGNDIDFDPTGATTTIAPLGKPDLFVAKYAPEGDLIWVLNLGRISLNNGMDAGGIAIDSNNDIVIGGGYTNTVNFNPLGESVAKPSVGGKDAFLAKYSPEGELIWVNTYGSDLFDFGSQVTIDSEDNIYFGVGFYGEIELGDSLNSVILNPQPGGSDAALVKFDPNGAYLWSYSVSSAGNDYITAIEVDSEGKVAIGATINGETSGVPKKDMKMFLLEENGVPIWEYNFNNFEFGNEITSLLFSDDNTALYVAGRIQGATEFDPSGSSSTLIQPLFADPFFAKYNTDNGSLIYASYIESTGIEDYVAGITTLESALIIVGSFDFQAKFIPGDFTTQETSEGEMDMYIVAYDKMTGAYIDAKVFGGTGSEFARHAHFSPNGNIAVTGSFSESIDIHAQDGPINSVGLSDIFLAEFSIVFNSIIDNITPVIASNEVSLFPVPANDYIGIKLSNPSSKPTQVKIMNIVGVTVAEFDLKANSSDHRIDITTFNSGVYILELITEGTRLSKRFIKN